MHGQPHIRFSLVCFSGSVYFRLLTNYLNNELYRADSFLLIENLFNYSANSPHFMEPESLLPLLQKAAIYPYTEPDQSKRRWINWFLEDPV